MKVRTDYIALIMITLTAIFAAGAFWLMTNGYQWEGFIIAVITALGFIAGHDYLMFR